MAVNGPGNKILEEDPFQGGPAEENDPGLDRPTTPAAEWRWIEPRPAQWAPSIRVEPDRITVTFHTY
jgi:hypothetical protein